MAEAHNAKAIVIPCIAAAGITLGCTVDLTSWTEAAGYVVTQSSGGQSAWGVYAVDQNDQDALTGDHVNIVIFGPCVAKLKNAITVAPPQAVSNDTDATIIADTTDKHRCLGFAMVSNGATTNYGEVFVNPHFNAA
jgi:hypothetical protein